MVITKYDNYANPTIIYLSSNVTFYSDTNELHEIYPDNDISFCYNSSKNYHHKLAKDSGTLFFKNGTLYITKNKVHKIENISILRLEDIQWHHNN